MNYCTFCDEKLIIDDIDVIFVDGLDYVHLNCFKGCCDEVETDLQ